MVDYVGCSKPLQPFLHTVRKNAHYAQHLGTRRTQRLDHFDTRSRRRNQVFDHHDLLPLIELTLDLIPSTVILRAAADISHRQVEDRRGDGRMSDACRRCSHQHLARGEFRLHRFRNRGLDLLPHLGGGQNQPVVAINRAFDTARPGKRLLGAQEYRTDREQAFGNFSFHNYFYIL